jgi:hypothetical protein
MIVLGCDLGAHLGYAIGDSSKGSNGTIIECDVLDLGKRAKQLRCGRPAALWTWANVLIKTSGVEVFCREDSTKILRQETNRRGHTSNKNLGLSLEQHAGYAAVLEVLAEIKKLVIVAPVDPRTLKKWATDNGNADKAQMTNAARMLYKVKTEDPNAADAAHVCAWAMKQVRNEALKFQGVNW